MSTALGRLDVCLFVLREVIRAWAREDRAHRLGDKSIVLKKGEIDG